MRSAMRRLRSRMGDQSGSAGLPHSQVVISGIVLEGVTGAGKSQILAALHDHPAWGSLLGVGRVFYEEETFGEFMAELDIPGTSNPERCWRLHKVMEELIRGAGGGQGHYGYVLER